MSFDSDLASSLRENQELIEDLCRYSEGILTERQVRQRWHLANDEVWTSLGADDFVERVELERVRRIRSGAAKREKAQLHVVAAADVLNGIMSDPKQSAKHRIDSAKVLNDFADNGPQRFGSEQDRVIIRIDLGADTRSKGLESNPADVLVIDAAVPNSNNDKIIDSWDAPRQFELNQEEPVRRGPGRPPGSKNKPKTTEHEPSPRGVPGFMID